MKRKIDKSQPFYRTIQFDRSAVNDTARTVTLSISSDAPYLRRDFFGSDYYEILDHSPGGVNTDRLAAGTALLFNHDSSQHLGRNQSFVNDGHKLTVTSKFSRSAFAEEKWNDVRDGILVDASVGYSVLDVVELDQEIDNVPVYRMKFEPLEASLVTVPADFSVGVGRTMSVKQKQTMKTETETIEERQDRMTRTQQEEHAQKIRELGTWFKTQFSCRHLLPFDPEVEAERFIAEEKTAREFQKHCAGSMRSSQFLDTMNRGDHGNGRGSIAEQIVGHAEMKRALEGGQKTVSFVLPGFRSFREGLKRSTNITTDVGPPSQYLPTVMGVAYEVLVVADLLAPGTMDTSLKSRFLKKSGRSSRAQLQPPR